MTDEHSPLSAVELQEKVVAVLGDHVYATCDESLEEVIANMLLKNRLTIGVAESCTGGFVAHRLTTIEHVDKIFVFDGGHLVEEGSYTSLMDKKDAFYRLAHSIQN